MINLNDYIKEVDGVQYVPLKVAQEAVAETYQLEKYQGKLGEAMFELKKAMDEIGDITEDLKKND